MGYREELVQVDGEFPMTAEILEERPPERCRNRLWFERICMSNSRKLSFFSHSMNSVSESNLFHGKTSRIGARVVPFCSHPLHEDLLGVNNGHVRFSYSFVFHPSERLVRRSSVPESDGKLIVSNYPSRRTGSNAFDVGLKPLGFTRGRRRPSS